MKATFLGNPALKAEFLAQLLKHEEADRIVKGTTRAVARSDGEFSGFGRYDEGAALSLTTWAAYLEDDLFKIPDALARPWPRRLAEAIPVGAVIEDTFLATVLRWVLADWRTECLKP